MKQSILLIFFYISTSLFAATDSAPHRVGTTSGNVRFAAIGDYGSGSQNEADVASLLNSWNVEFVITAGDNRYGNTTFDQVVGQFYCDFLKDAGSGSYCAGGTSTTNAFFPSLGNHDYRDGGGVNEYLSYFSLPGNERYYDFVWGPIHFFAINSDRNEPDGTSSSSAQAQWLQNQLAASTTPWQIVYFHHAPYSSGNHGSTAYMQWPFAAWGADAVITGHDHTYERINRDGIVYFVNGLGGASRYRCRSRVTGSQICYDDDYGAMLIEANESNINFQFINRAGGVIDTYNYNIDHTDDSINVRIIQSADDVEQRLSDGTMYLDSSDMELGNDLGHWGEQSIGLRFQNLTIPQGATITAAYIEFETDETDSEPTSVRFHGEAADNAAPFGTGAYDLTNRPLTAAVVDWNDIPAWNKVNEKQRSPDLSVIVQEIMDRPGWSANNSMVFVISGTGRRAAEAYDGEAAAAALLHVEYGTDDRDGDGLSDSYETENGLDPDNPHDAVADPDSDGLVNTQEAAMGTDPQVADTDGDAVDDWHDPAPLDDSISGIRLYEDAEDGLTDGWSVTDNEPNQPQIPTITNVSDNAGQVIQLSGNGSENVYKLDFGGSNMTQFVAQWDMNFAEPYHVMWNIDTDTGAYKQVKFTNSPLGCTAINTTVECGLGINSADGNWRPMMADLNAVVQEVAPNSQVTEIRHLEVRGSGLIDNVILRESLSEISWYETAEDGTTDRWKVVDNKPRGALISNVYDSDLGSQVIDLSGDGKKNAYRLSLPGGMRFVAQWSQLFAEPYVVEWKIRTNGNAYRWISFEPATAAGCTASRKRIRCKLDGDTDNGIWHNIGQDLADIVSSNTNRTLEKVFFLRVKGSGRIDDVKLMDSVP